jgi:hypothetical protein
MPSARETRAVCSTQVNCGYNCSPRVRTAVISDMSLDLNAK